MGCWEWQWEGQEGGDICILWKLTQHYKANIPPPKKIDKKIFKGISAIPMHTLGFPGGSAGNESAYNARDLGSVPELGRSPGERNGYPLQYSGLKNFMNCIVHGVTKSRTQLSDFHFGLPQWLRR